MSTEPTMSVTPEQLKIWIYTLELDAEEFIPGSPSCIFYKELAAYLRANIPVPVSERLPEAGTVVLAWVRSNQQWQYLAYSYTVRSGVRDDEWYRFTGDGCVDTDERILSVTHWLALPAAPEPSNT